MFHTLQVKRRKRVGFTTTRLFFFRVSSRRDFLHSDALKVTDPTDVSFDDKFARYNFRPTGPSFINTDLIRFILHAFEVTIAIRMTLSLSRYATNPSAILFVLIYFMKFVIFGNKV